MRFINEMSSIVGEYIIGFGKMFFLSQDNLHLTTRVSLIPKSKNPESISEYRPINVPRCLYKIISKVIARKIKLVMNEVISEKQTGFIEERFKIDEILTVNEVVMLLKRKRK